LVTKHFDSTTKTASILIVLIKEIQSYFSNMSIYKNGVYMPIIYYSF